MSLTPNETARLTYFDTESAADVVVIGAGIAGLSFALRLSEEHSVIILTKSELGESNTKYAQGGMAAAIGPEDTAELHLIDTIEAGDGLTDVESATGLVERGASAVRWLLMQGVKFDLDGNTLQLGNEAAHSRRRILHAGGDATGAEIERALVDRIRQRKNTRIVEHALATDLVLSESEERQVTGVTVLQQDGRVERIVAKTTVLANGGAGRIWNVTSNPNDATADGIAMAFRAGVELADLEFCQFHPTVTRVHGTTPFLVSEAVRGEGAHLVNSAGERFMLDIDPRAELAPRNVVAGAIQTQLNMPDNQVFLSLRHLEPELIDRRFPTIQRMLADVGLNMATDLIPVAPAAHYYMGGVVADAQGRTNTPGLLAIGEVSCTGVHGANRLASNSLLEGLVFGINAADALQETGYPELALPELPGEAPTASPPDTTIPRKDMRRRMMWWVGVMRNRQDMLQALEWIDATVDIPLTLDREALISRNMRLISKQITLSALDREESRGGHIRSDWPEQDQEIDGLHQLVQLSEFEGEPTTLRIFGHLYQGWDEGMNPQ